MGRAGANHGGSDGRAVVRADQDAILPLAGIGPNGVPLAPDSPLRDTAAIPVAIGLSLALVAVVVVAGAHYLKHKQI